MTRSHAIGVVLALAAAGAAAPAQAWNAKGHMMVAAVAWKKLDPAVRTRAVALLRLNPNYAKWTQGIPIGKRGQTAFVKAATWPDEIRSAPGYHDDGSTPPPGPTASQNIGYVDKELHRYWHFKDLPFSPDGTATDDPEAPNAATQIVAFKAAMAQPGLSNNIKSYDLAWVLHLVGDVHQPLHATSRFTAATPHGDNGGNSVMVCLPAAAQCNAAHSGKLHGFWDGAFGSTTLASSAITAAAGLGTPAGDVADADVDHWLAESSALAQSTAYKTPVKGGKGPYRLTVTYQKNTEKAARERVSLAGERLARLLNEALKPPPP